MGFLRRAVMAVVCISFATASGTAGSKTELPNDVTIELLGRCIIYSFTYQRAVSESFGIEGGLSLLGGSEGSVAFFSFGGRGYFTSGNASPCISGGFVFVTASTSSGPFSESASGSYGYIGPGFEFRSSGGFLFRGSLYFLIRDRFFAWPGIQLGIAF